MDTNDPVRGHAGRPGVPRRGCWETPLFPPSLELPGQRAPEAQPQQALQEGALGRGPWLGRTAGAAAVMEVKVCEKAPRAGPRQVDTVPFFSVQTP